MSHARHEAMRRHGGYGSRMTLSWGRFSSVGVWFESKAHRKLAELKECASALRNPPATQPARREPHRSGFRWASERSGSRCLPLSSGHPQRAAPKWIPVGVGPSRFRPAPGLRKVRRVPHRSGFRWASDRCGFSQQWRAAPKWIPVCARPKWLPVCP